MIEKFRTRGLISESAMYRCILEASFTRATFSCDNRHFALFIFQIEKKTKAIEKEKGQNGGSRS